MSSSSSSPRPGAYAELTYKVTTAGTYRLLGNVLSPSSSQNSFWVEVVGNGPIWKWHTPVDATQYQAVYVTRNGTGKPPEEFFVGTGPITIRIHARDKNTQLDTLELELVSPPVNSAPTDMTLDDSSVSENSANDTLVGTVTTTDPDTGETFSYVLTDNAGGRFAINATSGQITVADGTLLDFETATSHAVTVQVTDSASNTYSEPFTINVTDVPEGGSLVLEGESATPNAGSSFTVGGDSNASGGQYLYATDANTGSADLSDYAELTFNVTTAGTYRLLGSVYSPSSSENSFWVGVEGFHLTTPVKWQTTVDVDTNDSVWYLDDYVPENFTLGTGPLTVRLYSRDPNTQLDTLELELQGGALSATVVGSGANVGVLTNEVLAPVVNEAIALWIATGADPQSLAGLQIQTSDLGGNLLGLATSDQVLIDINGAGNGWSLERGALEEGSRIDLLSVVYHELGHVLGLGHEEEGAMQASLAPGESLLDDLNDEAYDLEAWDEVFAAEV